MRIEGPQRQFSSGGGAAARPASSGGFALGETGAAALARAPAPLGAAPSLGALLALQDETETPRERRRREVARGRGLLDALDAVRLALIEGRADAAAIETLAHGLSNLGGRTGEPGLDDALSAIELRAAVEVAKRAS